MESLLSSPLQPVKHFCFSDPDELAAAFDFRGRITPLTLEPFSCHLLQIDFEQITFFFTHTAVPFRAIGPRTTERLTFAFLLDPLEDESVVCYYRPVHTDTLFGFDITRESNLIVGRQIIHCHALIDRDVFYQHLALTDRDDIDERVLGRNFTEIPSTIGHLKTYFQGLYHLATQQPDCLQQPAFQRLIEADFIPLLIQAIPPRGREQTMPPRPYRRADLVQQAEDFLLENLTQPINLASLCQALFVSKRTLFYGFDQVMGTSPMTYLKILRLQAIHHMLKTANPQTQTVSAIASEHGFYSMGHFARDYKILFGQTPRDTLKTLYH